MLDGIDPLLTGELLWRLDAMGHSDGIALVDAHFPQPRSGQPLLVFPGVGVVDLARAVRTVLPLDPEIAPALMSAPSGPLEIHRELADAVGCALGQCDYLSRQEFYARAGAAVVIVRTGERRGFGNIVVNKGLANSA